MRHAPIGIMQGRLSPPEEGRFQSFPRISWREEFPRAQEAGLKYIEWIYDDYGASVNPIGFPMGRELIGQLKAEFQIDVPAICVDWLMDYPLVRCDSQERHRREEVLHEVLRWGGDIGVSRLVLPFVDASSMKTEEEKGIVIQVLENALPLSKRLGVELHLEADLNPDEFARLLNRIDDPMVKVNYDSGNSSGLGYIAREEFAAYGKRIGSIHLKDRLRKADGSVETKPLGEGSANFDELFANICGIGYGGGFTLQVARDRAGDEVNWAKQQAAFIGRYRK
jgi:L-ribulose-5-phosphate 3-epimerase